MSAAQIAFGVMSIVTSVALCCLAEQNAFFIRRHFDTARGQFSSMKRKHTNRTALDRDVWPSPAARSITRAPSKLFLSHLTTLDVLHAH
ncbi:uncharacterized protein KRP23_1808 [Phytophthora ramorum]|uniref:uncharacterized protein n=1 Tax=Phytophthora ramorum TaxID=164328 RepID=UPI0030AA0ECC|nr:hypothetical protein KRP23_1808 [Phytophthora ramorum]